MSVLKDYSEDFISVDSVPAAVSCTDNNSIRFELASVNASYSWSIFLSGTNSGIFPLCRASSSSYFKSA